MEITTEQLNIFINLYHKKFGVLLNKKQALELSNNLLVLIKIIIIN